MLLLSGWFHVLETIIPEAGSTFLPRQHPATLTSSVDWGIDTVLRSYPEKRVVVAFPPNRHSEQLRHQATASFRLGRRIIADSQFPKQVIDADGFVLRKPSRWN